MLYEEIEKLIRQLSDEEKISASEELLLRSFLAQNARTYRMKKALQEENTDLTIELEELQKKLKGVSNE